MPEVFTRSELRKRKANTQAIPSGARSMTMVNNLDSTAYFNMEHDPTKSKGFFKANVLSSPVNCSFIVDDNQSQVSFIINPHSSGSVTWTLAGTLAAGEIEMSAPNPLVYSTLDPTSSGSIGGVETTIS